MYSFQTDDIPINCFYINFDNIWVGTYKDVIVYSVDYKVKTRNFPFTSLTNWMVKAQVFKLVESLGGHSRKINSLEHPTEDELWSCSDDGKICVWSLSERKLITSMDVNAGNIRCLRHINNHVWAGGSDNSIICWSKEVSP